jgi:arylsulfatase A-like enzyme
MTVWSVKSLDWLFNYRMPVSSSRQVALAAVGLIAATYLQRSAAAAPKVILMILADDLGYGDLSYLRNTSANGTLNEHYTPHIDQLAQTGIILSHHYTHFYCTPSRCSLLSGRLPMHVQQGQAFPETPNAGIPRNMTTIGTKMQQAGYRTHVVGK